MTYWKRVLRAASASWPALLLALCWTVAPLITGALLLIFIGPVSDWASVTWPWLAWAAFVFAFVLVGGLGLLPTYAMAVTGAWIFGGVAGLLGTLLGFVGAAILGYGVAGWVSRDRVVELIRLFPKVEAVRKALLAARGWQTILVVALLRVPPQGPFALTNLAMASAGTPFRPFLTGTALGMVPRCMVIVLFAAAAASTGARDLQEFLVEGPGPTVAMAGLAVMLVVLVLLGLLARRALTTLQP